MPGERGDRIHAERLARRHPDPAGDLERSRPRRRALRRRHAGGLEHSALQAAAPRTRSMSASASAGRRVGAPGDVAVGAHQHEAALVERGDLRIGEIDDLQGHAAPRRSVGKRSRRIGGAAPRRSSTKPLPKRSRVERPVVDPGMRRARSGPRHRHELRGLDRRRRGAVGDDDGRRLVAIAEPQILGEERRAYLARALRTPRQSAGAAPRPPASPRRSPGPLGSVGEEVELAGRGAHVVERDRLALDLVGVEQPSPPQPCSTATSFQPRSTASARPVWSPSPPVGEF